MQYTQSQLALIRAFVEMTDSSKASVAEEIVRRLPMATTGVENVADVDGFPGANIIDKIQAGYDVLTADGGGMLRTARRGSYALNGQLDLRVGRVMYDFSGATMTTQSLTSGYAVRLIPDSVDTYNWTDSFLRGLRLQGPQTEGNDLDGVYVGEPGDVGGGNTHGASLWNCHIRGFRRGLSFGAQTWLNHLFHCAIGKNWSRGVYVGVESNNMGESIAFHGGVIYDSQNAAHDAVGIEIVQNAAVSMFLVGTSLDFNDRDGWIKSGVLNVMPSHIENHAPLSNWLIEYISGRGPHFTMSGGLLADPGSFGGAEEPVGGKASFIDVSGGLASVAVRDMMCYRFAKPNTEIVRVLASRPIVVLDNVDPVAQDNAVPIMSRSTNRIAPPAAAVSGWRLKSTVNYVRNGVMGGAAPSNTAPTAWAQAGSINGLTRTIALDYSSGRPTLLMTLSGTANAAGSYGLYFDASTAIPAAIRQTWTARAGVRMVASTGIDSIDMVIVERDGGGGSLANNSTAIAAAAFSPARTILSHTRTFNNAGTTGVQAGFRMFFANGATVNATIAIDTPMLTLDGDPLVDVIGTSAISALPAARHAFDAAGGPAGNGELVITNTGTGNYGLYQEIPVRPGRKLLCRAQVSATITSGSVGLFYEWLDAAGNVMPYAFSPYPGGLLTATTTGYVQRGSQTLVPANAARARLYCWTESLNGSAAFADVMWWEL